MTRTSRTYVDLPHGQVHVRLAGDAAGTPLVLVHQVPSSSAMWEAVMVPFAALGYHVMAVDLPGYGLSDPLRTGPELEDYARVVVDVLHTFGHDSALVAGHHTGSSVASVMAGAHPESVRAIAVWGYALLDEAFSTELASEEPPLWDVDALDRIIQWWNDRSRSTTLAVFGRVMPRSLCEMLESGAHRAEGHNAVGRADHLEILHQIKRPALLMTGSLELLDAETRRAAELGPEYVELAFLGDLGGDAIDDATQLFVKTVHAFFERAAPIDPR